MTKTHIQKNRSDHYSTPVEAYQMIQNYIPQNIRIYDPFYCDGSCAEHLRTAFPTCEIIHQDKDAFSWMPEFDMIITNPPYSLKKKCLEWMMSLDKPFCCFLPGTYLMTKEFSRLPGFENFQFVFTNQPINCVPRKDVDVSTQSNTYYTIIWYCYKMNLPKQIQWSSK